ncbi:MAG: 50S ribosomal protein L10 [Candidatus Omnitrophica bacterium]|nr:50S ribosomal protein L10 [Candidatus Omnitrophota bacterium]
MKKLGLLFKEVSEKRIKTSLKESDSVFVINYAKLSGPDLNTLRLTLKDNKANLFVIKNTVARRALKDSGLEALVGAIDGPCGLIFTKEEPVDVSKALYEFAKTHEALKLQGGTLKDKVIDKKDIETLAKLPSKEALRAKVVMTLNSPIFGLVYVLNQTLKKFVYCLDQIKQKKTV